MKNTALFLTFIVGAILLALSGCTDLRQNLPTQESGSITIHPDGWTNSSSPNFHLNTIESSGWDMAACRKCHGTQYTGGTANVSCMKCHVPQDLPNPGTASGKVHPDGWKDSLSAKFHGIAIRNTPWILNYCQKCHGTQYTGGIAGKSCLACHNKVNGPENCSTCHGGVNNPAPPVDLGGNTSIGAAGVGAHQKHLVSGTFSSVIACSECHTVPAMYSSPGHIDSTRIGALILFNGTLANTVTNDSSTLNYSSTLPLFTPTPSFDVAAISCSNTYCHGDFKNGNNFTPTWNDTTGSQAACGTCHGDITQSDPGLRARPKSTAVGGTHPQSTACWACHVGVIDRNLNFIDKSKHINGKLNVFGEERDF
ncbi:MAG: CxxxxCH/CxxCH domain-containing protein [Bacteroidota bacterium]